MDALYNQNIGLAYAAVQRTRRMYQPVDADDILSAAFLGLWDACRKYDPARDLKFSTYATSLIMGFIRHEVRKLYTVTGGRPKPPTYSLSSPLSEEETGTLGEIIPDHRPGPLAALLHQEEIQRAIVAFDNRSAWKKRHWPCHATREEIDALVAVKGNRYSSTLVSNPQ